MRILLREHLYIPVFKNFKCRAYLQTRLIIAINLMINLFVITLI